VGVYGTVAGIVKLDDAGLALSRISGTGPLKGLLRWLGLRLLDFAPLLLKTLAYVGTLAMFMVGGGILIHGFHDIYASFEAIARSVTGIEVVGPVIGGITPLLLNTLFGLAIGAVALGIVKGAGALFRKPRRQ
jgi:predicted DNA repair protein MutK